MANNIGDLKERGLVVFKDGAFVFSTESNWRSNATVLNGAGVTADLSSLQTARGIVAPLGNTDGFVSFDLLLGLPKQPVAAASGTPSAGAVWNLVVLEQNNFLEIPSTAFNTLSKGAAGDAGVLVRRGTVVASIPQNSIPSGSFCVLVNFDRLRPKP